MRQLRTVSQLTAAAGMAVENSATNRQEVGKRIVRDVDLTLDHLTALLAAESDHYGPCSNYLALSPRTSDPAGVVSEAWRVELCEWCYQVVDHFEFGREVVSIAQSYLDRAASRKTEATGQPLRKREFQLLAVTSLYIAIKIHGENDNPNRPRHKLKIDTYVELSRNLFSVETIENMERAILSTLQWMVNPPTMLKFVHLYLQLLPEACVGGPYSVPTEVITSMFDLARYLTELAVCVSKFSFEYKHSVTAYAALLCALDVLPHHYNLSPEIKGNFLCQIAEVTGLTPGTEEVRSARALLQELCPSMFESENTPPPPAFENGKASPVCVTDHECFESPRSSRKRVRTCSPSEP